MKLHKSTSKSNLIDENLHSAGRSCKEQDKEDSIFHQDNYFSQFHLLLSLELDIEYSSYLIIKWKRNWKKLKKIEKIEKNWKKLKKIEMDDGYQKQ